MARDWLQADLVAWGKILQDKSPENLALVRSTLAHWKVDSDLAGIRNDVELFEAPRAAAACVPVALG